MPTEMPPETVRQSTRIPTRIPVTLVSLNPYIEFSEACYTEIINAQGCAIQSAKPLPIVTPVLLRLTNGKEAAGQVAFCAASSSDEKSWGVGIMLDQPGNVWGIHPCPKDWL